MGDQRQNVRVNISRKVGIVTAPDEILYLWTSDLSHQGLQLFSEDLGRLKGEHDLAFCVIDADSGEKQLIQARVQMVHRTYVGSSEAFRVGMQFVKFYGDSEAHYRHYLDNLIDRTGRLRNLSTVSNGFRRV